MNLENDATRFVVAGALFIVGCTLLGAGLAAAAVIYLTRSPHPPKEST